MLGLLKRARLMIEPHFYDSRSIARLFRKQGATIGRGCVFYTTDLGTEPYLVTVGDDVLVSDGVRFLTHDGSVWSFIDRSPDANKFGRIRIGARAFIGAGVTLLPGANVGERSVIGAGAVVCGEIPPGVVAAGVPARVLMTLEEYERSVLARSLPLTGREYAPRDEDLQRRELERLLPALADPRPVADAGSDATGAS